MIFEEVLFIWVWTLLRSDLLNLLSDTLLFRSSSLFVRVFNDLDVLKKIVYNKGFFFR